MDSHAIGAAAAVQALKISASQNQSQPQGAYAAVQGYPASSRPDQDHPTQPSPPSASASSHPLSTTQPAAADKPTPAPGGGGDAAPAAGPGGPQDKIVRTCSVFVEQHLIMRSIPQIALAMAQAGKLFDKKNGGASGSGNSDAKVQGLFPSNSASLSHGTDHHYLFILAAMHSAASMAMRLCTEYKSTGKVNLQPGEMQGLIGAAMSFL